MPLEKTSFNSENIFNKVQHGTQPLHHREVDCVTVSVFGHPDPQVIHLRSVDPVDKGRLLVVADVLGADRWLFVQKFWVVGQFETHLGGGTQP